jgi:hypothetical protein
MPALIFQDAAAANGGLAIFKPARNAPNATSRGASPRGISA